MNPVLEFRHVSKQLNQFAIQDVSFKLDRGYVMGLVGPNGAGKTTLFNLLLNQYKHYEGAIFVDGLYNKMCDIEVKDRIGLISEANSFFLEYDATTNARLYAPLYTNFDMDLFESSLISFGVPISIQQPLSTFSKGTMMKFQLAFALAHHPVLYLMDEPTAGLDPIFRRDFIKLLQEIVATEDASILIATHITTDLDKMADFIGFLDHGKLIRYEDRESLEAHLHVEKGTTHLRISDLFNDNYK